MVIIVPPLYSRVHNALLQSVRPSVCPIHYSLGGVTLFIGGRHIALPCDNFYS